MATSNFLDQDFGSESEDDNFNPAPAGDSDDENADASDTEASRPTARRDEEPRRKQADVDVDDEDRDTETRATGHRSGDEDASGDEEEAAAGETDRRGPNEEDEGGQEDEDEVDGDEDDDEEEEDEEEEITGHRRKRARRGRGNQFLDVEAEVDEDEDEADEEDDELQPDGFIADTHPDDLADLPAGGETDDRMHIELDRRRELEAGLDAEKQAAALKERYGRNRAAPSDSVVVPKRLLLPSVNDPSIWGVRCKPGKEREVVFALMKRIEERATTRTPLAITSAFERGGTMAGYIYVEARKQPDILSALDGLSNVYPRTKMVLVPIKEMPDLLRTTKSKSLEPGMYVRIKRGKYMDDLAQVNEVETNGLEVQLRIVPRLDYGLNEDANAPMVDNGVNGGPPKRKRQGGMGGSTAGRPPQRLFSEAEAKKKHHKYLQAASTYDKKTWNYLGERYVNGFLIKDMKIQYLQTEDVNPTLGEVTRFTAGAEDGTENLDLAALAASLKASTATGNYLPGDMVEVYDGEQRGVSGKAVAVHGDIVTIKVAAGELAGQTIEVPTKGLRKCFREGDHVKVVGGTRFQDEVGMVVRIRDDRVTLLSDANMSEITVFSKHLREAADSGVTGQVGNYELHDLVQLDPSTVACIINLDKESFRVLDQNGSVRTLMPSQISNKIEQRRNAVATDRNGSELRTDDTVKEISGEQKQGRIIHIYRSYLFLHSREQLENTGIFVLRASNVATVAAKGGRLTGGHTGPDLNKMNPALQRNGGAGMNGAMPPPKSYGRDRLIDKTVTVRRGPYKGLLGIVKDTTDNEARVELHTKSKTITVPKDTLGVKDPLTGQSVDYKSFAGGRGRGGGGRGGFGDRTPSRNSDAWQGGRTPISAAASGQRTPAWGMAARTPAWSGGVGVRTPAWKQDAASGGRTPGYGGFGDGSRTVNPYADGSRTSYGSGNKTPAWNPSSRTPYAGDSGFGDSFASGSRTPAPPSGDDVWNPSSDFGGRTPAYSRDDGRRNTSTNGNAQGSRPYDAPTPGANITAPTPGAFSAPTPMAFNAPTPAASAPTPHGGPSWGSGQAWRGDSAPTPAALTAPTPGASHGGPGAYGAPTPAGYNPETPAAWGANGGDDEPRYEEGTPSP
ncbi:MAG: hypothetical protein M1819_005227 [Sarea resinae]|nr:MAG: hypothetical protein M1819_005227 [Sarea resinae]